VHSKNAPTRLSHLVAVALGLCLLLPGLASAQTRVGSTQHFAAAGDAWFPDVAYDGANNAYLVAWGLHPVMAQFVSPDGARLGSAVQLNSTPGGAVSVACGTSINACLVIWIQEPRSIVGRLVRYSNGAVQPLGGILNIHTHPSVNKNTALRPSVAFAPTGAGEFLVAWTEGTADVLGMRVSASGAPLGSVIAIAATASWEGTPSVAYNSQADEYGVAVAYEPGYSGVGMRRVKAGTGALLGWTHLYGSAFEQYPEIAYNSDDNQYLVVTWHGSNPWMLHGQRASAAGAPIGGILALAASGGGDGVGLSYNPVANAYFAVYQSQYNGDVWGTLISGAGAPGAQFQVTVSGTGLSVKPQSAPSTATGRWLVAASRAYIDTMSQLVQHGGGGTTPTPPAAPTPVSPTGTISTSTPTFTWRTSVGASQYRLWVDDSTGNRVATWYTASQLGCASTATCSVSTGISLAGGTAKFWVQAWSSAGYSSWSSPMTFTVPTAARVATLLAPTGTITGWPVTFRWTAVAGATYYRIWVNDTAGNKLATWVTAATVGCAGGGTCATGVTFASRPLVPGTVRWWVQAWSASTGDLPWSAPGTFIAAPLAATTLLTPNGAYLPTGAIEFGWNAVPGATYYMLWIDDQTGTRFKKWYTAAEVSCAGGGLCVVQVLPSLTPGTVSWWIQAWNPVVGYGPWSTRFTFTR
jgi:hypothetical protein